MVERLFLTVPRGSLQFVIVLTYYFYCVSACVEQIANYFAIFSERGGQLLVYAPFM